MDASNDLYIEILLLTLKLTEINFKLDKLAAKKSFLSALISY
jgi:hypothetical protein